MNIYTYLYVYRKRRRREGACEGVSRLARWGETRRRGNERERANKETQEEQRRTEKRVKEEKRELKNTLCRGVSCATRYLRKLWNNRYAVPLSVSFSVYHVTYVHKRIRTNSSRKIHSIRIHTHTYTCTRTHSFPSSLKIYCSSVEDTKPWFSSMHRHDRDNSDGLTKSCRLRINASVEGYVRAVFVSVAVRDSIRKKTERKRRKRKASRL